MEKMTNLLWKYRAGTWLLRWFPTTALPQAEIKSTYKASFDPWETWYRMKLRCRHDSRGRESQIGLET
jgi:hypothetical protein